MQGHIIVTGLTRTAKAGLTEQLRLKFSQTPRTGSSGDDPYTVINSVRLWPDRGRPSPLKRAEQVTPLDVWTWDRWLAAVQSAEINRLTIRLWQLEADR